MNEILNGIPLTTIQHYGSHGTYNSKVLTKLNTLWNKSLTSNWNNVQCENAVRKLGKDIRTWIGNHPNESINNIIIP